MEGEEIKVMEGEELNVMEGRESHSDETTRGGTFLGEEEDEPLEGETDESRRREFMDADKFDT